MQVELNNATGLLAVIGDPVAHSRSPLLHNAMLARLGLNYIYLPVHVLRGRTAPWLDAAREAGFQGFNATMPHKTALVPLMDELSEDAARCGAVNTVRLREGRWQGFNTDGIGFLRAMEDAEIPVRGRKIAVLGAGGAVQSVALKLASAGAAEITVLARTVEKAEALVKMEPGIIRARPFSGAELNRAAADCDLLVNGTPLGMAGVSGNFEDFSFLDALPPGAAVCDLIYSPLKTKLLQNAENMGHRAVNGLGMLIHQAICALELFTDENIERGPMAAMLRKTLTEPISRD